MEDLSQLQLNEEDIKSLKETFYQQAVELIESLVQETLSLEGSKDIGSKLKTIKRIFHTLKGDSASIGLKELARLTHRAEDLIQAVENKSVDMDSDVTDLLLRIADCMSGVIDASRTGKEAPVIPVIIGVIDDFLKARGAEQSPTLVSAQQPLHSLSEYERLLLSDSRSRGKVIYECRLSFSKDCRMKSAGAMIISQHIPCIGDIIKAAPPLDSKEMESVDAIGLLIASKMSMEDVKNLCHIPGVVGDTIVEKMREDELAVVGTPPPVPLLEGDKGGGVPSEVAAAITSPTGTIRVESEKVDQIMDLVGELIVGRSMIAQLLSEFEERFPREEMAGRFAYANSFIERSLSDLQRNVMKVRMLPIDRVFKRFPRVVRDLAKASNKDSRLVIHGEDTEVDKGLVDVIGEPLIHIVRNAIDHGIETVEEREAAGKNRQGTIVLEAYHQGNDIVIEVSDDGRGIDPQRIKAKALEKGFISQDELETIDDRAAIDFIFLPGFSTAKVINEVSGRGVGMDVVKAAVEGLRGSVNIRTEAGRGTTFVLRFPLTLAIIKAILFSAGERLLAIPLGSVKEITRVFTKDVEFVAGREVLRMRERVIPLVRLEETMNLGNADRKRNKLFVIIVSNGDRDIGIAVNKLVGEEELFIKAINDRWVSTNIVGGASILGDGKVVLILNVDAIIKKAGAIRQAIGERQ
ncbi:MAG: chemotaxis protein CheA [Deltaproteobacteria bacterium]|nr:chemotaxis protein CheA [Deltaproteobacteria bacterium]